MTRRVFAIAAAVLWHVFAVSLEGQTTPQMYSQRAPLTKQQLARALQEYREKKDLHGEAVTLLQLGIADVTVGDVDGARSNLAEAAKKMRTQNDLIGVWVALTVMSQLEIAAGRPSEALPHLEKALTVLNEAKTSTGRLSFDSLMAVGATAGFLFQLPPGLDESVAAAMKPMLIQFSLEPVTHDLYGSVLTQAGQLEKAETELNAAVAGAIYAQGMYDFSIESHFGDLRLRQQRYDEARTHYTKALNASSKTMQLPTSDLVIKAAIYERLARVETITGHPDEAKRWSEKARDLAKGRTESH